MSGIERTPTLAAAATLENEQTFIVFSEDWGEHPSSCQHLFRRIASEHRVLWVNTVGMRTPKLTLSDLKKARLKLSKMLRGTRSGAQSRAEPLQLHVTQPMMLPFSSVGAIRSWNRRSVVRTVSRVAAELGIRKPTIVCAVPNACDFVRSLSSQRVVYYCVDDFAQWPGLDHELVREMDRQMIEAADVLIVTSQKLKARLGATGKPTHLLHHGVDLELFGRGGIAEHASLSDIPRPRAGYFGLFDQRSDMQLIVALAKRMQDFSFVFTGPATADVQPLHGLPNVHLRPPVPYQELPALIAGLDVLFLPYVVNDFTDSISPLKLKEYLATGKPVVTTPMAEALPHQRYLQIATGVEAWEHALRASLDADVEARKRVLADVLAPESWDEKMRLFLSWCLPGIVEHHASNAGSLGEDA